MLTIKSRQKRISGLESLQGEFSQILNLAIEFDEEYKKELESLDNYLVNKDFSLFPSRQEGLIATINEKFRFNANRIATFLTKAAGLYYIFNYHDKVLIKKAFDYSNEKFLTEALKNKEVNEEDLCKLLLSFNPVQDVNTLKFFKKEYENPSKLRREKESRDIRAEILKSLFSSFLWISIPPKILHEYFDPQYSDKDYVDSFWNQLITRSPKLFSHNNSLHIVRINQKTIDQLTDKKSVKNAIVKLIQQQFKEVSNYGFLAMLIDPISVKGFALEWEIIANLMLVGEKFRQSEIKKGYFRWKDIERETLSHIKGIDPKRAQFNLVNEGFTYKDCFVMSDAKESLDKLLLLFQKNERDETPISCPACRNSNVRSNSYSSLGVRSWECNNLLCPDRSKYNRGKRYSFKGMMMQQAIEDPSNSVSTNLVRKWQRDILKNVKNLDVFDMLIRHFSMVGDGVHLYNWNVINNPNYQGRKIYKHRLSLKTNSGEDFFESSLFERYITKSDKIAQRGKNLGDQIFQVFNGDATSVLKEFDEGIFDGAVTSPPYYNARKYSQWKNIYCYLHDMHSINTEVFRTLKPGAVYLYNIFDYFDNERTVAFSAMGQKRMILSAYTVDSFKRIGFDLIGNIVWDKGDIEGKRGFNAGNYSPFYQTPFNCWEHILIVRKPGGKSVVNERQLELLKRKIFRQKPVFKIVKGNNRYGHTAPFPEAIPELLMSLIKPGSTVLDPFSGSMTTGRVAERHSINSINIEVAKEYCDLGLKMRRESKTNQSFDSESIS